jgi:hypothetical protein
VPLSADCERRFRFQTQSTVCKVVVNQALPVVASDSPGRRTRKPKGKVNVTVTTPTRRWALHSAENVRSFVESVSGGLSRNEYFPVADARAIGLPQPSAATA